MITEYFRNKSVLLLHTDGRSQYTGVLCEHLRAHFAQARSLDYAELSLRFGTPEAARRVRALAAVSDVIFVFKYPTDFYLPPEFFAGLDVRAKVVFWYGDDEIYFDSCHKYYAQAADAVVTNDYSAFFSYRKLGIDSVLSYAANDEKVFRVAPGVERNIDVSFVGNCLKGGRIRYIKCLEENGIRVETYGRGSKNGHVSTEMLAEIFSASRISLNFTRIDEPDWISKGDPLHSRIRQSKGRPVEIALCGAFCLSEPAPSLGELFEIGREIDVFYGEKELLEKVGKYLSDDSLRGEMASRAHDRAVKNYTARQSVRDVLVGLAGVFEKSAKHIVSPQPVLLSEGFKTREINGLAFTVINLVSRGRFAAALSTAPSLFRRGLFAFVTGALGGIIRSLKVAASRFRSAK